MRAFLFISFALCISATRCGWLPTVRAPNGTSVRVLFALPYTNEAESEALFQAVSDPDSPRYREFLSADEVQALVAPEASARGQVQQFLQHHFPAVEPQWSAWGHFVHFRLTVQEVEDMLQTQCFVYQYACGSTLRTTIKTVGDSFPAFELSKHLAYVGGVAQFPFIRHHPKTLRKRNNEAISESANASFAELRELVSVPPRIAGLSSTLNPVQYVAADKQVYFIVSIVCPDGAPLVKTNTCRDGSKLESVTIRSARGSDPQAASVYSTPRCGYFGNEFQCIFLVPLEDNWVRVAFGFDLLFDSGSVYSYNVQHYIVGTEEKTSDYVNRFYSVPSNLSAKNSTSYQAVGALTLENDEDSTGFYDPKDLSKLYGLFGVPPANVKLVDFKGAVNDPARPDVETSLDIEWISAMAPGARSTVWHSPPSQGDALETIVAQIQEAAKTRQAPYVLSLSYGGPEASLPLPVLSQHEAGFRSLGLLGVTVLAASGDTGPYWDDQCDEFMPVYPASSQYVTSVGATQLVVQNLHNSCKVEESVCSVQTGASITSGGGFSAMIPRPAWQREAVDEYLRGELPNMQFQRANRAYPDISLFGRLYTVVHEVQETSVDGTSASAPTLGGLITLINDLRFSKGLGPLGFLNPALYRIAKDTPESFHDVVAGSNGCTRDVCCQEGFQARSGWDAATGLGSPVFQLFAAALEAPFPGSWTPLVFPEDLDCGSPLIQPNKESPWNSTKLLAVAIAITAAVLGIIIITACWYCRQRRRVSPAPLLQEELVHSP